MCILAIDTSTSLLPIFVKENATQEPFIKLSCNVCKSILCIFSDRFTDLKDEKNLVSRALPDNKKDDHYLYEILTFTGQWKGSSCDSKVYFTIKGDEDGTEERQLDPGWKDTLRKGTIDSYVMKVPR